MKTTMSEVLPVSDHEMRLAAFWEICQTKEHLNLWIREFLGLELPGQQTCTDDTANPATNSSPLDLVWEMYQAALHGHDENRSNFLAYANRDGGKTLACSVFEIIAPFHLRRDVGHMAAIEPQALRCLEYIDKYCRRPIIRDYVSGNNKRTIEFTWYTTPDGQKLSPEAWKALVEPKLKAACTPETYTIRVVICTKRGANSLHCSVFVADEVDLADPVAFQEAEMIPTETPDGRLPIVLYTSSRKYSFGLMQAAITNAEKTKTNVRHWNVIDNTKPCPPKRHLPEEPRIPIWYLEEDLVAIGAKDFEALPEEDQKKYTPSEGYAGCLKNCAMFAMCRGRLATKPKSRSRVMKSVHHTQSVFRRVKSLEVAKAQLMCWKPEASGLVYPKLNRNIHLITAAEMAKKLTGEDYPSDFSKMDLIRLAAELQLPIQSGCDHGYRHQFAFSSAIVRGLLHLVINVIAQSGLELDERVELCNQYPIAKASSNIYADPAYPADNKTFKRNGYRIHHFNKDVDLGIQNMRRLIYPVGRKTKDPDIYFLKGDPNVEYAFERMEVHHFKVGPDGKPTNILDDDEADVPDSLRYLVQNTVKVKDLQPPHKSQTPDHQQGLESIRDAANRHNRELMAQYTQGAKPEAPITQYRKGSKFFYG